MVVSEVEGALPTAANATTGAKVAGTETTVVIEAATDAPPTAANAAEETEGSETVVTVVKAAHRADEAMAHVEGEAHNAGALPMEASEGPKASAPAMPITAHRVISERLVRLSERMTERT